MFWLPPTLTCNLELCKYLLAVPDLIYSNLCALALRNSQFVECSARDKLSR